MLAGCLLAFYGISTMVVCFMPNLYSYILNKYDLVQLGFDISTFVHYLMLNPLIWFDSKSTIVGYLMPNPVYTYLLNMSFK